MRTISCQSILQIVVFIVFIVNTQFTHSYASVDNEGAINKIFETHGKKNVVSYILQRRNGKITIQKKKSFLNITGKPDIALVTAKSINHDLKFLKIDISKLESELDIYIENESKKQQKRDDKFSSITSASDSDEVSLSRKLKYQIKTTEDKYNKSDSAYERKRLKRELSRLQRKYKEAKYNEKHKSSAYSSDKSPRNKRYNRSASYCNSYKSKLQKLTASNYRHQIFFCNDRAYRAKNPKSCATKKYSKRYTLQEYKDEINRLRSNISKNCGS